MPCELFLFLENAEFRLLLKWFCSQEITRRGIHYLNWVSTCTSGNIVNFRVFRVSGVSVGSRSSKLPVKFPFDSAAVHA